MSNHAALKPEEFYDDKNNTESTSVSPNKMQNVIHKMQALIKQLNVDSEGTIIPTQTIEKLTDFNFHKHEKVQYILLDLGNDYTQEEAQFLIWLRHQFPTAIISSETSQVLEDLQISNILIETQKENIDYKELLMLCGNFNFDPKHTCIISRKPLAAMGDGKSYAGDLGASIIVKSK